MTLYAHVNGTTVDTVSALPRLCFDGTRDWDFRPVDLPVGLLASLGWHPVARTPRPTITPAPSPTVTPSAPAPTLTPGCVRSGGGWLCYGTTPPTP